MTNSLSDFLSTAKHTVRDAIKNKEKVTLVIGNENADLDSIVSAIFFAYHRTASPPSGAFTKTYVPVAQISQADIASDAQLSRLLSECQLQPSELITLDDIVKQGQTQSGLIADNTRILLVNQNELVGRLGENYSKNIIGCIDNHEEQNYVPKETGEEPRIVGKAGSSTSLAVNYVLGSSNSAGQPLDPKLARLGLGAILVNTEDMHSRVTDEDERAIQYLQSAITDNDERFDRSQFYNTIIGREETREPAESYITPPSSQPNEMPTTSTTTATPISSSSHSGELLPIVLGENFKTYPSGSAGTVGISTVNASIKDLIIQSEHDIAERSIQAATTSSEQTPGVGITPGTATGPTSGGTGTLDAVENTMGSTTGTQILPGSPFTAACREFAVAQTVDVFGILTNSSLGREVFVWVLNPSYRSSLVNFVGYYAEPLGLGRWEGQNDEIVKEAGMSDGLMKVYWIGAPEATADVVAGMLGKPGGA